MKHALALIPARAGSKELPNKNIQLLCGKPLMAYTIEAARESGIFDDVVASVDTNDYADIARSYGASVPFLRDASLSGDTVPLSNVTVATLRRLYDEGNEYKYCCVLQATCPLRDAEDIRGAYETLCLKNADSVVSVSLIKHPHYIGGELQDDLLLENFIAKQYRNISRQGMKKFYAISGAICFVKVQAYMHDQNLYGVNSYAYKLSKAHALDIDTHIDFAVARILLNECT